MFSKRVLYPLVAGLLLAGESEAMLKMFGRSRLGRSSAASSSDAVPSIAEEIETAEADDMSGEQRYSLTFFKYLPSDAEKASGNIPADAFVYRNSELRNAIYDSGNNKVVLKANSPGVGLVKDRATDKPRFVLMNGPNAYNPGTDRLLAQFSINPETEQFTVTAADNSPVNPVTAIKTKDKRASELASRVGFGTDHIGSNIFRVVRGKEGHVLRVGDVIKLGRTWLRVHQIVGQRADGTEFEVIPEGSEGMITAPVLDDDPTYDPANTDDERLCQYCFQGPVRDDGQWEPLAHGCLCSDLYSHRDCLRHWKRLRWQSHTGNRAADQGVRTPNDLKCEICLSQYSMFMSKDNAADRDAKKALMEAARANGEFVDELDPKYRPDKTYYSCMVANGPAKVKGGPLIIFENLTAIDDSRGASRILPVSFAGQREGAAIVRKAAVASMGRDYQNQIEIVGDEAMSNHHATIQLYHERFVVRDHDSKYGTLVMLPNTFSKDMPISNSASAAAARKELEKKGVKVNFKFDDTNPRLAQAQKEKKRITFQIQIEDVLFDAERFL